MFACVTVLLFVGLTPARSDPKLPLATFSTGDEMVYSGEVNEESSRVDLPYKRKSSLEVRVFVLNSTAAYADLAVLTSTQILEDPNVAGPAASVTGQTAKEARTPAVSLELVRIDAAGKLSLLAPILPAPFVLNEKTSLRAAPLVPVERPATSELGFYFARPRTPITANSRWKESENTRPDINWQVQEVTTRQGTQVYDIAAVQHTAKWDNPTGTDDSWRRSDRYCIATSDGLTRQFLRTIERKEGIHIADRRAVNCELTTPPSPHRGEGYTGIRKEIEAAYAFELEYQSGKTNRLAERIETFLERHRETPYRVAIEAVRRRAISNRR
jgi:hypothetical protein